MDPIFRSKVDLWLIGAMVAVPVLALYFIFEGTGVDEIFVDMAAAAICAVVLLGCAWFFLSTRYTLTGEALLVKSGPFSWVVPLREISSIEPTGNPSSSPAFSLDRLRIRYREREIMISPADKDGFMREITQRIEAARARRP